MEFLRSILEGPEAKALAASSGHALGVFLADLLGPVLEGLL